MVYNDVVLAIQKGAVVYANVSGGKDGQAMTKTLVNNKIPVSGLIHADLGRIEWKESIGMCVSLANNLNIPLHVVKRKDGLGLIEYWKRRMHLLKGTGKPFWSSSAARYCTSDLKREPINKFYRNCGNNFIISAEGIRASESKARAKKFPLVIRANITSSFYKGMTVTEAIKKYRPDKRLALTWFPIFNFSLDEVWATYKTSHKDLLLARKHYQLKKVVPKTWPFHPAYVYGNNRVSCSFCVLGCLEDLQVGAQHHPEILQELIAMEKESGFSFKHGFSLKELL
jgi:3'-phosphoadenosine 5'-phosphosulfate sulfotransferase (PAPS reductase)/FAD synthetase